MQHYSNIEGVVSIEGLVTECKPLIERLARKFVGYGSSLLDFDDYVSVGMTQVWLAADVVLAARIPLAYACKVAENAMVGEYNKLHKVFSVSLDALFTCDSDFSLVDLLSDDSLTPVSARSSRKVRVLDSAVRRLSSRQRAVIRRRHALFGYGAHSVEETARVLKSSKNVVAQLDYAGRQALRSDVLLCKAVGVSSGN